jgi:ribonuclease BN (tRNA processing enzyme)
VTGSEGGVLEGMSWRPGGARGSRHRCAAGGALLLVLATIHPVAARAGDVGRCGERGVALQVLGSGGPELQGQRASSSNLVWFNGRPTVLVDVGGGAALRFGQSGASVTPLALILLTHLHVDHTADLPALVKSSFFENRTERLPLYGPAGNDDFPATTAFVAALFGAGAGAYRYLAEFLSPEPSGSYRLDPHDLKLGGDEVRRVYEADGIRVFATAVVHGGVPALAYRVEIGGARLVFSGDTNGDNGNLERLARDADVLLAHNAVRDAAAGVERSLHMPPAVIGRIAHDARVRELILSHRMRRTLGHEAETEASIRRRFEGPLVFANDLDCFPVNEGPSGDHDAR